MHVHFFNILNKTLMHLAKSETFEFPSVEKDGKFYTLDLTKEVNNRIYAKTFLKDDISRVLSYNTIERYMCFAEIWIIKQNPKYNYLWKENK
jgi:hypothetical protein